MGEMKKELLIKAKAMASSKKVLMFSRIAAVALVSLVTILSYTGTAFAADLDSVATPIVDLLTRLLTPILAIVSAGGAIFCVFLGIKYATAEEPQEKEKRKQALKTAIIGYLLIFILVVALKLSIGPLTDWMYDSIGETNSTSTVSSGN
jgi:hypothetical protein